MPEPRPRRGIPKEKRTYKYPNEREKRAAQIARRQQARIKKGKNQLALPLEIIPERTGKGSLAFKSPTGEISVKLQNRLGDLQGVYQVNGDRIVTVRASSTTRISGTRGKFSVYVYDFSPQTMAETGAREIGWFDAEGDLAHHHMGLSVKRRGLGQKIQSKIDRHTRSTPEAEGKKTWIGAYGFQTDSRLIGFFRRLDYKINQLAEGRFIVSKSGKTRKTNDMRRFHTIEAIDPKTGRVKEYVFPISGK